MSKIKVNSLEGVGASTPAISIDNASGTCTANLTNKPNRNLIINGAMQVAQRGTSSTSDGIHTVDRFGSNFGGTDEAITQSQVDVAAGTTPYTLGFRKAFRLTNGNQTSGAGASDYVRTEYRIEAQDIANSGWNYTSSSSNITLSFWVKSSVSKNFNYLIHTSDGTSRLFPTETGTLSADTWTKVTKTISGDSNLTFNNDNGIGIILHIYQYLGTTYTASSVTNNQWQNYSGSEQTPEQTSTWWTTNDATFEITGVQLEVGSVATDFEHRSFAQELPLCQRYFHKSGDIGTANEWFAGVATHANHGAVPAKCLDNDQDRAFHEGRFPVLMRANPTLTFYPAKTGVTNTAGNVSKYNGEISVGINSQPSSSNSRLIGYFSLDTNHPAFTFQYTADAEL